MDDSLNDMSAEEESAEPPLYPRNDVPGGKVLRPEPRPLAPRIAVIGFSGSGKTTYFRELYHALQNEADGADVMCKSLVDEESDVPYFFPPPTPVTSEFKERPLMFTDKSGPEPFLIDLTLIDPPGQAFHFGKDEAAKKARKQFVAKLNPCDGLLIILGAKSDSSLWRGFADTELPEFKSVSGRPMRVAVVVSQADRLPFIGRLRPDSSEGWVTKKSPELAIRLRGEAFQTRYYFASSAGWTLGVPNYRVIYRQANLLKDRPVSKEFRNAHLVPGIERASHLLDSPLQVSSPVIEAAGQRKFPDHVTERTTGVIDGLGTANVKESRVLGWNLIAPLLFLAHSKAETP